MIDDVEYLATQASAEKNRSALWGQCWRLMGVVL
jgi:hypothetical protein